MVPLSSLPTIIHQDKHFSVFLNGPETFTLFEIHDISFLSNLINDENINKNDKRIIKRFINEATKLNSNNAKTAVIPIEYSKTKNSGQYSTKLTLQNLSKPIKDKIYDFGEYANLDIANKGFTVIYEVAKINGIELPIIKELIENRDKIYAENEKCWNNSFTTKYNFCYLIPNPIHFEGESVFISKLIDELIFVGKIFQHSNYPEFTTSKIIEIYTTLIMMKIVDFLVSKGIIFPKCYSLNGDSISFQPLKSFEIKDIEKYIFQETSLNINLH
uniref:Uncharacterized protein n=1 Tax=Panagrolaimus sp. PS1159 TaxID=55785 RepID=A0AC35FTY9_9BILA